MYNKGSRPLHVQELRESLCAPLALDLVLSLKSLWVRQFGREAGCGQEQGECRNYKNKLEPRLSLSISSLTGRGHLQEQLAAFTTELHMNLPRDGEAEGGAPAGARKGAGLGAAPLP